MMRLEVAISKIAPFLLAALLLLPFVIIFWRMARYRPPSESEVRAQLQKTLEEATKLAGWQPGDEVGQGAAFYTYHVTAVPWALSPDALKVFPMIDKIIKGEGTLQLSQRMQISKDGWSAVPGV